MRDAVVVGAGITGATVARLLSNRGRDVLLLDDGRPMSGTGPSGGHLRPSWFRGMPEREYRPAMGLLDEAWGLVSEDYAEDGRPGRVTIHRVDTDAVLAHPRTVRTVLGLDRLDAYPAVTVSGGDGGAEVLRCRLLVVAAGAWAADLVGGDAVGKVTPKQGVSFRVRGRLADRVVRRWAPYKQVVAHQQTPDEFWVGDGSAILPKNWTGASERACLDRCLAATVGRPPAAWTARTGLRPYLKPDHPTDPCVCRRIGPRAWCVTGAGKSGTIAAGWAGGRILDALGG